MAFDWNDYMLLAAELRKTSEEAYQRSAVSRGYYAAYNVARRYLTNAKRPYLGNDHQQFWEWVRAVTGDMEIASMGQRVRGFRRQADYDYKIDGLENTVATAMMQTAIVLTKLRKLEKELSKG